MLVFFIILGIVNLLLTLFAVFIDDDIAPKLIMIIIFLTNFFSCFIGLPYIMK